MPADLEKNKATVTAFYDLMFNADAIERFAEANPTPAWQTAGRVHCVLRAAGKIASEMESSSIEWWKTTKSSSNRASNGPETTATQGSTLPSGRAWPDRGALGCAATDPGSRRQRQ